MLCEKCNVISLDDQLPGLEETTLDDDRVVLNYDGSELPLEFDRWDTFPDFPDLQSSARGGCGFCSFLRATILEKYTDRFSPLLRNREVDRRIHLAKLRYQWDRYQYQNPPRDWEDQTRRWEGLSFLAMEISNADRSVHDTFGFDIVADEGQFVSDYLRIHRRPLSDTLSKPNIDAMLSWRDNCIDHQDCTTDTFIPTRLIDLGSNNQPTRLILTSEDSRFSSQLQAPQYLALSYCWGPPHALRRPLKTETRSLRSRMRGIRLELVPATIADSFTTTRALGYQFIWIDSLCIIQDDEADWQKESAVMRRVYGSATITLVAASSKSSHDGFLRRPKAGLLPVPYRPTRQLGQNGHFYLQRSQNVGPESEFYRDTEDVEWNKRGWTFQENLASPLVLYFGSTMFHYRCQREIRAENTQAVTQPQPHGVCWGYELGNSGVDAWLDVVWNYSGRKLTYQLDKLPALSALAHDMQRRIDGLYLAGLWSEDLVWGLLWECVDLEVDDFYSDIAPVRCPIYRAPSWSWAAGDGAIAWYPHHKPRQFKEQVLVEEAKTTVSGEDPLGRVTDGNLTLTGKLQDIGSLMPTSRDVHDNSADPYTIVMNGLEIENSYVCFDWSSPADVLDRVRQEGVWILLLASYVDPNAHFARKFKGGSKVVSSGLVLSTVQNGDGILGKYRRVGMFRVVGEAGMSVFQESPQQTIAII